MDNKLQIILQAVLDKAGIIKSLDEIQKALKSTPVELAVKLDKKTALKDFKKVSKELSKEMNKVFGTNISGKQLVSAFKKTTKEADKLSDSINELKRANFDSTMIQFERLNSSNKNACAQVAELRRQLNLVDKNTDFNNINNQFKTVIANAQELSKISKSGFDIGSAGESVSNTESTGKVGGDSNNKSDGLELLVDVGKSVAPLIDKSGLLGHILDIEEPADAISVFVENLDWLNCRAITNKSWLDFLVV